MTDLRIDDGGEIFAFRKRLLDQADSLHVKEEIPGLRKMILVVNEYTELSKSKALKISRPIVWLRTGMSIALILTLIGAGTLSVIAFERMQKMEAKELFELAIKAAQGAVVLPIILSVLFIEKTVKRGRFLKELRILEILNDAIYQYQFTKNSFGDEDPDDLLVTLDACCGMLFLVRAAAGDFSEETADNVVLERVSAIRRGSNDNHRNILMKIAMAKNSMVA